MIYLNILAEVFKCGNLKHRGLQMPHTRKRQILPLLVKRLKLWPVLGLIGARQTGKSTLLRELLIDKIDFDYFTMDSKTTRALAERSPDSFCEPENGKLKIIDEIQKVPPLFDAVKFHVDKKRRPGTYILSGSTEFSQFTGIQESLTGRIGILHLYPFNLTEIHQLPFGAYWDSKQKVNSLISAKEFSLKLKKGGMPGLFYLHNDSEWEAATQLWFETSCYRDLAKIMAKNFDGELALSILTELAQAEEPNTISIAQALNKDSRVVTRYLEGFVKILIIKKIKPHPLGIGKDFYYFLDSGLASFLGANSRRSLESHILNECLSHYEYKGIQRPNVSYYKSQKGAILPFILEWKNKKNRIVVQISENEEPRKAELAALNAFIAKIEKHQTSNNRFLLLTPTFESHFDKKIEIHPYRG